LIKLDSNIRLDLEVLQSRAKNRADHMLHYATIGSNDIARATGFYDATMAALGLERCHSSEDELGYAAPEDTKCRLWVVTPFDDKPANPGNGTMIALYAPSHAAVDAFHAAAMANGGKDEGAPGLRAYGPHFYACYIRDPDGNKLSAVCEAPSIS
jgi:catechol 2,3-dioxygenase-like lactoylglutathione lyase family enzyme